MIALTIAFAIVASYFDRKHRIIPNALVLFGLALGIAVALVRTFLNGDPSIVIFSMLTVFAVPFVIIFVERIARSEMFGGGDIKFLCSLGALIGPSVFLVFASALVIHYASGRVRQAFAPIVVIALLPLIVIGE